MLPSSYNPTTPDMFIGPAQAAARHLEKLAKVVVSSRNPFRIIFSGPPGVGKSKLASLLLGLCGSSKWNTTKLNGTQVKIEEVEDVARQFHFRDLLGTYRFLWVEEIDKTPAVARSRLLTLCDDMPDGWALIGTTNLTPNEFKALHHATKRRYSFLEVAPPGADDIFALLRTGWPALAETTARHIAVMACGCVGEALQEADSYLIESAELTLTNQ